MTQGSVAPGSLQQEAHHDGSPLYLPEVPEEHGDPFTVLLRTSRAADVRAVAVRQVIDGEPLAVPARVDRQDEHSLWWRADLVAHNPLTRYRFLLDAARGGRWLTAAGPTMHDPTDATDFQVSTHRPPPAWVTDAVAYQVFPDRFARSGLVDAPAPDWAEPADWTTAPVGRTTRGARQLFGGDLNGVRQHLDHIAALGCTLLYLTPVFPAGSSHRYDATSFDRIDPLLGGDAAYRALIDEAHARGMRVLGDLTTNHTGRGHDWFQAAQAEATSDEAGYYYFTQHPDGYVGWLGHQNLPKLDLRSPALVDRLVRRDDSVVARWLAFGLDGWRIDVANMTGRYRDVDVNHAIAREIRATLDRVAPEAYLAGEHFHDHREDLDGSTWHGAMNYSGFTAPMWSWLVDPANTLRSWMGMPVPAWPRLPGPQVLTTMRLFSAVPWPQRLASMTLIGSHDTPRIRTVTGDRRLVEVAVAMMVAHPGVPVVWAGDEIGLPGSTGEDGRWPFPWHDPGSWDRVTLGIFRDLIALRSAHPELRTGSMRWVHCDADRLCWMRESPEGRTLVLVARAPGEVVRLGPDLLGMSALPRVVNLYGGAELRASEGAVVAPGDGPTVQLWKVPGQPGPQRTLRSGNGKR